MRSTLATLFIALLGLALGSCVATPLPTPPTADVRQMSLVEAGQPERVDLLGAAGALSGELLALRVSSDRDARETPVSPDGSFAVRGLGAAGPPVLYLEALTDEADVFLVAVTAGPGTSAVETTPGPDRDGDGSPDAVDCAPDDGMFGGQRCPVLDSDGDGLTSPIDCDDSDGTVFPGAAEACDGIDDDCDFIIDEACVGDCVADADCAMGLRCLAGVCSR